MALDSTLMVRSFRNLRIELQGNEARVCLEEDFLATPHQPRKGRACTRP